MGGTVKYFGKPYKAGFDACLSLLPPQLDASRVLHVGDSLDHDIAGANNAGVHSLFVAGGIHASELPSLAGSNGRLDPVELESLFDAHGGSSTSNKRPTYSIDKFVW